MASNSKYGRGRRKADVSVGASKDGKRGAYTRRQMVGSGASGGDGPRRGPSGGSMVGLVDSKPYSNDPLVLSGSGTREDPYVVQDVHKALELLEQNYHIALSQPREVATLVAEMQNIAQEARAKGEDAPVYNLCNVSIPGTNVFCADHKGVLREHMPQLSGVPTAGSPASTMPADSKGEVDLSDAFMGHMQSLGYGITAEEWPASELRATQSELVGAKVAGMSYALEEGKIPRKAIYITRDGYVVDGHHRWAANLALDMRSPETITMPVYVIDADILEVLDRANSFAADAGIPQRGLDDKSGG